jgi:dinuclear metal center YbgI/SA1388 family protein
MLTVDAIAAFLGAFAPLELAEDWDNVGLLIGDRNSPARRIMTCLTITPESVEEALDRRADLVVAHHPFPFHPLKRATTDTLEGRLLWMLAGARVSVYSPHTAFDSAREGINRRLAEGLGLVEVEPLVPPATSIEPDVGGGRRGRLSPSASLAQLAERVKTFLRVDRLQIVGSPDAPIERVAVACGSAGEFLAPAREVGCQCLVTGETRFHTCLEAQASGMALVLAGHYATERFAVEALADVLQRQFPDAEVWASGREHDPVAWL